MLFAAPRLSKLSTVLLIPSTGLLIAYLWALFRRPAWPDELKRRDPEAYGFPSWYGAGASPYDTRAKLLSTRGTEDQPDSKQTSVLLLIVLPYDSPHTPHALATLSGLDSLPAINATVLSAFSREWNATHSYAENLRSFTIEHGCPDWIWLVDTEGAERRDWGDACGGSVWISETLYTSQHGLVQYDPRANVTLLPRPQDLLHASSSFQSLQEEHPGFEMGLFSHILPFADFDLYYPTTRISRRSVTYFPSPLTPKADWPKLPWRRGWTIHRPSRNQPPKVKVDEDPWAKESRYRRFWAKEQRRRAKAMRQAGICLFEDWDKGLLNQDIVQAMLSGCIVASIVPGVQHEIIEPLILTLPQPTLPQQTPSSVSSATDANSEDPLNSRIDKSHPPLPVKDLSALLTSSGSSAMAKKAVDAFIVARELYTPKARVRAVSEVVETWKEGGRGYLFPNGFRWDCKSTPKPGWCK